MGDLEGAEEAFSCPTLIQCGLADELLNVWGSSFSFQEFFARSFIHFLGVIFVIKTLRVSFLFSFLNYDILQNTNIKEWSKKCPKSVKLQFYEGAKHYLHMDTPECTKKVDPLSSHGLKSQLTFSMVHAV